jgi:hypothetical protein
VSDTLRIVILEDGTIKTETPEVISPAVHSSADSFLRDIAVLTGGPVTRTAKGRTVAAAVDKTAKQGG